MKTDNQHLEYLISQYVDGCLDGASKKSLEQKMITDPVSRQLYKEQREVQDVLDDWGSRIPLINWNDFDQKLAARLEHEVVGGGRISVFKRWARPMAAAAALFVAATAGYAWHAWSVAPLATSGPVAGTQNPTPPSAPVVIHDMDARPTANSATFVVDDAPNATPVASSHVAIIPPDDREAARALHEAIAYGMEGVTPSVTGVAASNSTRGPNSAMNTRGLDNQDAGERETTPVVP